MAASGCLEVTERQLADSQSQLQVLAHADGIAFPCCCVFNFVLLEGAVLGTGAVVSRHQHPLLFYTAFFFCVVCHSCLIVCFVFRCRAEEMNHLEPVVRSKPGMPASLGNTTYHGGGGHPQIRHNDSLAKLPPFFHIPKRYC